MNVEAVRFAVEHARWLAEQHIYFLILGSVAPRPERSGALIVTGRVPDVVPYFAASDVGLNPITRGAGANVKLFEYIASGLPVISTSFGVRGTSLVMHQDYVHFEADDLLTPLTRFVREGDAMYWRGFADRVWERHRAQCDITEVMRDAIQCARDFPSPDSSTAKFEVVS